MPFRCKSAPAKAQAALSPRNNLSGQSFKVLLVGCCDELRQAVVVFCGVERLAPRHGRALRVRPKFDGEHKVMPTEVFDFEELIRNDACEAAFVRVVLAIRSVHR